MILTLGQLRELTNHLDDETEIVSMSVYDFDESESNRLMSVVELVEIESVKCEDSDVQVVALLFEDDIRPSTIKKKRKSS